MSNCHLQARYIKEIKQKIGIMAFVISIQPYTIITRNMSYIFRNLNDTDCLLVINNMILFYKYTLKVLIYDVMVFPADSIIIIIMNHDRFSHRNRIIV